MLEGDVENPDRGLFKVIQLLDAAGATVAGIPCNTAHAPRIFSNVLSMIHAHGLRIKLHNMIADTVQEIQTRLGKDIRVGVLSTLGTYKTGLYREYLEKMGIPIVQPDESQAIEVHSAIYHPVYGIKACSNPVSQEARRIVEEAVRVLSDEGANVVILGCTELPIALPCDSLDGISLIDPTAILARTLIKETYPEKLQHYPTESCPEPASGYFENQSINLGS